MPTAKPKKVQDNWRQEPGPGAPTALGVHIFGGGFSLGVRLAGFQLLGHLEDSAYGVETARRNLGVEVRVGERAWREVEYAGRTDFLYANPPCAIFSSAGISTTRGPDAWRDDPRLGCWRRAFRVFRAVRPRVFALESVCQAYTKGRPVVDSFTRAALADGYSVVHLLEDAKWCGVPQSRKRFFFVAHDPALPLSFDFDWTDPPTVGAVLRSLVDPGDLGDRLRESRRVWTELIADTEPGRRLSDTYDRLNPEPESNGRGRPKWRPSFNCRRLRDGECMGAFVGDFYAHPTEDRFLGTAEMRALCGYPTDWWLEGRRGGHASLLARAVIPPVGRWLAGCVRRALGAGPVTDPAQSVMVADLRTPPGSWVDLTAEYCGGECAGATGGEDFLEHDDARPFPPEPPRLPPTAGTAMTLSAPVRRVRSATVPPTPRVTVVAAPVVGGPEVPLPGEGSGAFVRRLWMTGRYAPERLVELVHANWEGRTTRVSDVYYNYKKLLEAGVEGVPPWPRKSREVTTALRANGAARVTVRSREIAPAPPDDGRPRLLLTGSTPIQVGSDRTALGILTAVRCWAAAFAELGYAVDWRPVVVGEDLSGYDAVVASLAKPNSIGSSHVHGVLWALRSRPDAVLAFDDWQVVGLQSDMRTCAKVRERTFKFHGDACPPEHRDDVQRVIEALAAGDWPYPSVLPVLGDGDVGLLRVPGPVIAADPTAFARRYDLPDPRPVRGRRWVQASLLQKPLPDLGWPVEGYGWRATSRGLGGLGDGAQPRLREPELMAVYAASWGVLSPAHPHAGSGWWRVRYLMAADAGCVLSANPREAACLGEPYLRASDPRAVERLGDLGLRQLARAQRDRLAAVAWPRERVLEILRGVLKTAAARR